MKDHYKLIGLSAVGACFELFDFLSFIFLSSVLANVFFPSQSASYGLFYTFAIFSTGYFFRPIGGILLAHFGDRYGRKQIFVLTLMLMSLPSLIIAVMPTTQQVGMLAPILLALLRMIQGVSLGGEVAGSTTYVAEFVSEKWRTFTCSLITAASNIGVLSISLVVNVITHYLSPAQMIAFGRRIPFLIGAVLGLFAVYLRKQFSETPLFLEIKNKSRIEKMPFIYTLKNYFLNIIFGVCLVMVVANSTFTFHLFFPAYLTNFMHSNIPNVLLISSTGVAILAIFSPIFALTSMYFGRKKQCFAGACMLFIICLVAAKSNLSRHTIGEIYLLIIIVSLAIAFVNSVLMAMLADLFPTPVRFTGVAVSYNVGCLMGAGFAPLLNTGLLNMTGYLNIPFLLVAVFSLITMVVVLVSRKKPSLMSLG